MVEEAEVEVELEPLVELGVQGDHLVLKLKQRKNCDFKWVKNTNTSRVLFYVYIFKKVKYNFEARNITYASTPTLCKQTCIVQA